MAFLISEFQIPFGGDGDGGGNTQTFRPLPLAVTIKPVTPVEDPFNPTPIEYNTVTLPPQYRVAHLLFMVFRNGVEQVPKDDFNIVDTQIVFIRHFDPLQGEVIRLYGYGFSA